MMDYLHNFAQGHTKVLVSECLRELVYRLRVRRGPLRPVIDWMFVSSKNSFVKINDGIWRWNIWKVLRS